MKLSHLLSSLTTFEPHGNLELEITEITDDSRKIEPGNLFVAIKGLTLDSHSFIPQAINAGAIAIVGEKDANELELGGITYIKVSNSRFALGKLASQWFNNPSQKLKVIGVTGTEGKTTTSSLIYHILQNAGKKTGLISTIGAYIGDKFIDTGLHTTNPEALPLQELLNKMVENECEYAILETTSIGLHQGRVSGVKYHTAVLTNITQDHLDYHKTKDAYREAKALLFENVGIAILNKDNESFKFLNDRLKENTEMISYGMQENADFKAENIISNTAGFQFDVYHKGQSVPIKSNLLGMYNVSNMMAAIATTYPQLLNFSQIQKGVETFQTPEGRLERIDKGQPFSVFVDFAHTATAIKNVLQTLREITPKNKKLIAVYGAAGLRDAEKRPEMGKWGAKLANITIFTMDDPRTEDVNDIIDKMVNGALEEKSLETCIQEISLARRPLVRLEAQNVFIRITDRKEAIEFALKLAKPGDIVALLGKGHEKSLAVGQEEIPWSDQEVARKILQEL